MVLLRSIATIGGFTLISRIFGFIRDILIAGFLGAGLVADAFFVALKFPNLFRRLFAEGAFSAAFVPLFVKKFEAEGREAAETFAAHALSVLLWSLAAVVAVFEVAMPWIMYALAPGFSDEPEKFRLAILLTRITFPYLLFVSLVTLLAGVMNALGKFWHAAATPIILNLSLIGAVLGLSPLMPSPGHALAWGVFGAGVLQIVWMVVHTLRAGVWLRMVRPAFCSDIKLLLKRMAPVAVGAGIYQINLLIDTIIASLLPEGSISYLFYADRVNQLPLGVIGVAVGTALLPLMSRQLRAGEGEAAQNSQNRAIEFTMLLTVPAAVALIVLAEPIIVVLFHRGAFGAAAAHATAMALAVYAVGVPAYVLNKSLATAYFAREDTVTPIVIGVSAAVLNICLNLILMGPFLHVGIAMATAISSWFNAVVLAVVLYRRGHLRFDARLCDRLPRTALASAGMGAALWFVLPTMTPPLAGGELERALALAALVVGGLFLYGALAWVAGAARYADVISLRRSPGPGA